MGRDYFVAPQQPNLRLPLLLAHLLISSPLYRSSTQPTHLLTMFSRVATVTRGPMRSVASRGFSVGAAATLRSTQHLSFGAAALVVTGGLVAVASQQQQQQAPASCTPAKFPYTGVPGTANERSFIVSYVAAVRADSC